MKKIISLLLVILLCGLLTVPTLAAPEAPVITLQPQNYQYPEYAVAMYTVKVSGSNLHCTWYLEYEGKTYNISDNTNGIEPWEGYAGENYGGVQIDSNTFSWFFGGIEEELDGAEIWCVIEDGHYEVVSARAIITVHGDAMPPEIIDMPAEITVYRGDSAEIRCQARSTDGSQLEYTWYETNTGKLQDIRAIDPEITNDFMSASTERAGVRYYVCGITTSKGGRAYSSVVPVTVLDADPEYTPEMEILTKSLPDAVAGQPYQCQLECNDPYGLFALYYNPGHPNQLEESGMHLTKENEILGTPQKAGKFTFTVCASGDYGEDYMEYTLTVREAPEPTDPTEATEPEGTVPAENPTEIEPSETEPNETKPAKDEGKDEKDDTIQDKNSKDHEEDEENTDFPWWGIVLIAFAGVGVGIGATVLLMKKKS